MKSFIVLVLIVLFLCHIFGPINGEKSSNENITENSSDVTTTQNSFFESMVVTPHPLHEEVIQEVTTTESYFQLITPFSELTTSPKTLIIQFNDSTIVALEGNGHSNKINRTISIETLKDMIENKNRFSKSIDKIIATKPQEKSKLTVFLAAYMFYPLYELLGFLSGYVNNDPQVMARHTSRYLTVHLRTFGFFIFTLRVPVVVLYLALVVGHRFVFIGLIGEPPKTLLPDGLIEKDRKILKAYYSTLRAVGYLVGALGDIQVDLRERIKKLKHNYIY